MLCTYQALVKGKQSLVDLKDVIVPTLHEILHDDVKLVGVGEREARFHEHILHFRKWQLKGDGECNDRGLGRLVGLVRADLREELPVNICLLVALYVRPSKLWSKANRASLISKTL